MTNFKKSVIINIEKVRKEENKMVEKNKKKELDKAQRVWYNMNTGTITHKDKKHPSRQELKRKLKKYLDNKEYL